MRKALLVCGVVAPLLYIAADIVAAMRYPGYSYVSQVVSELSAVGAPTQRLLFATGAIYGVLVIAFGIGVLLDRSMRAVGLLIVVDALVGSLGAVVPMNPRGSNGSLTDTLHLVYVVAIVGLMIAYIAVGASKRGKAFRVYSIATIVALLLFFALTTLYVPRISAGLPTPGVGLVERVSVYAPVVWLLVFAIVVLRAIPRRMIRPA